MILKNDILTSIEQWGIEMRQIILYPGEDGYWVAECPSLPGCVSQGSTKEEAILNIREAIQGYIAALEEDGLEVPEERFQVLLIAVWVVCRRFPGETAPKRFRKLAFTWNASKEAIWSCAEMSPTLKWSYPIIESWIEAPYGQLSGKLDWVRKVL
jgi:predicted RNase H-like HicB family nuclease